MSRRLDGVNPLAYMGVKPVTPAQMVVNRKRRPTTTDLHGFQLGTWWIIPKRSSSPSQEVWILINKTATVATWIELDSGGGSVVPGNAYTLLTPDGSGGYGPNVGPGSAGQVLLSDGGVSNPSFVTPTAGTGLSITSNGSTLEYALDASVVLNLAGNTGGDIPPDAGGTINVVGTGGVNVAGAGNTLTITSSGTGSGFSDINVQTFTSNGTYTPTSGMAYCIVECVGGGGGGSGAQADGNNLFAKSGGGGAGYCKKVFDAATIGASQSVTVGAGGAGGVGTDGYGLGANGNDTTFGALLTAGKGFANATTGTIGGAGGTASGGDININGSEGGLPVKYYIDEVGYIYPYWSGAGGNSFYGVGGGIVTTTTNGNNGTGYGSGGGGAMNIMQSPGSEKNGGNGADGIVIVTEFIE